jgi:NodT family efflux transporter outer membrane factor (OMF) lipoprotein
MRIFGLTMFVLAVTFGGCTVGPNYERPQEKVPGTWSGPTGDMVREANEASAEELVHWWTTLGDETLTSLVERAVKSNLTVRRAEMQIRQARAARGIAAGGAWPSVDATGSFVRSQPSGGATGNLYHAGLDAAWEVDIFGGVRRSIEAAEADVQAAVEEHRDVLVTLSAEVALNYIDLRGFQQQIVIARNNLAAQKRTASLTRERFQGGFVSALDAANAEAQAATTAAGIPLLESAARQTIYVLSVLLGREPSALVEELSPTATIPGAVPRVPVAVPSELLRRRPDIRRAEAQIHAATARIGVATADLFPRISLPGAGGYQGSQFGSLTDWKNRFWSLGPSASWTVFDAGRIGWNIELQKALKEQSFIAYRQTVLTALQEVENALIASAKEQEHREALVEAAAANRKAMELSTQLYTQGQTDFLNVLQAERALYSSEDALVQSTRDVSTNLVALYKALGGGWSEGLGASAIRNKPE